MTDTLTYFIAGFLLNFLSAFVIIRLLGLVLGVILLALGIRARYTRNPLENPEYRVIEEK